jgi:hypothetical protein
MKAKVIIIMALLFSAIGLSQSGEKFNVVQLKERSSAPTSSAWGDGSMYFSDTKDLFIKKNGVWTLVGDGDAIQDGSNNTTFFEIRTNGLNGFELGIDGPTGGTDYVRINGGETVGEAPLLYITDNRVALSNYSIADINSVGAASIITKEYGDATYGGAGSGDMAKATYDSDDDGKVDQLDDGTNNIDDYLMFISSITNKIEIGESDPVFFTDPWIRLTAGNQGDNVTLFLTDNRATLEGYSDSEINAQGAASLVTKGYGDNNWLGADWSTNLTNIPAGFADGVDNDTQLTGPEVETAYNNQVPVMSQAEAEAGTSTLVRRVTAERLKQAIEALAPSVGGSTNLTYTPSTRLLESDTGTDVTLPLADETDPGLFAAADKTKLNYITLSNPLDLDGLVFTVNGKEDLVNKSTDLSSPDNTKYPTTLAVSSALSNKISSDITGLGAGVSARYNIVVWDYDVNSTEPTPGPNDLIIGENVPISETGTGAADIPLDGQYYGDMSSANTATAYTTDATKRKGGWAKILINAASLPTVDGDSTYEEGKTFAASTDMYLVIYHDGSTVKKFLLGK